MNLRTQAAVTLACSVVGNLATLAVTAWMIRHLGSDAYGRVTLLGGAAGSLSSFAASGFALYALRSSSLAPSTSGLTAANFGSQLIASITSVAALCATMLLDTPWSLLDVVLAAIVLHCMTADAQYKGALAGRQAVLWLAAGTLGGALSSATMQVLGALLAGPRGYLAGLAAGTFSQALLSWYGCLSTAPNKERVSLSQALALLSDRSLLRFVGPATLSASLFPVAHWTANAIAAVKGSYSDVALLSVALQFFNMVMFVPTVMNKIVLPRSIRADREDRAASRARAGRQSLWMLGALAAPALVWVLQSVITDLYRFDHPAPIAVLYCFTAAAGVACMLIPISNYLVSQHRMWLGLASNAVWAGCFVVLTWWLPGAALAVGIALLVAYAVSFALVVALALWGG